MTAYFDSVVSRRKKVRSAFKGVCRVEFRHCSDLRFIIDFPTSRISWNKKSGLQRTLEHSNNLSDQEIEANRDKPVTGTVLL